MEIHQRGMQLWCLIEKLRIKAPVLEIHNRGMQLWFFAGKNRITTPNGAQPDCSGNNAVFWWVLIANECVTTSNKQDKRDNGNREQVH